MVLSEKPVIDNTSSGMEPALLDVLLKNLSSLSAVYHKPPEVRFLCGAARRLLMREIVVLPHAAQLLYVAF